MTFLDLDHHSASQKFSRSGYLSVVKAGLEAKDFRFAREASISWLAAFPGDLSMSLLYAQALIGEDRLPQALQVLQGLCMLDVEFVEAAQELIKLQMSLFQKGIEDPISSSKDNEQKPFNRKTVFAPGKAIKNYVYALTGEIETDEDVEPWAADLFLARTYIDQKQPTQAEELIRQALSVQAHHPLIAVTHLRYLQANQAFNNWEARQKIAARYFNNWPDCLACSLFYADWLLENGDSTKAVAMLHQAAARDVGAQIPRRLWGDAYPYKPLWPETMELSLGLSIPADVAYILGWNRLPDQASVNPLPGKASASNGLPWNEETSEVVNRSLPNREKINTSRRAIGSVGLQGEVKSNLTGEKFDEVEISPSGNDSITSSSTQDMLQASAHLTSNTKDSLGNNSDQTKLESEDLLPLKQELERLAKKLNLPGVIRQDGRYPIYVIFSLKGNLEAQYGKDSTKALITEMNRLGEAVRQRKQWGSRVYLADDAENLSSLGLKPIQSAKAYDLKLGLVDLDHALAKRGEMIGALLIVGGPEIVPFHSLPNPVDDQDDDVSSDNPYATRDENYFMPEWPVGRLPGGVGLDPKLLLDMLRRLVKSHQKNGAARTWYRRFVQWLFKGNQNSSFGYTAAVWQNAAKDVFRPIGEPKALNSSPPLGLADLFSEKEKKPGKSKPIVSVKAHMAYFNLHGMEDAANWYGQRDPLDPSDGPDFPIALRPQDIEEGGRFSNKIPQVIFSEACFGLHILGREVDDAISLKFLDAGSSAIVGSTCMAYGSIDAPLVAADLLGYAFWKYFQSGLPAGEALRQAKIHLAKVMNNRQGYLDGEDQKTIISFVLYGDPLASKGGSMLQQKSIWRKSETLPQFITISDRKEETDADEQIPEDVLSSVRQVVSQYLPGMSNAKMMYSMHKKEHESSIYVTSTDEMQKKFQKDDGKSGIAGQKSSGSSGSSSGNTFRRMVTLSKQIPNTHGIHAQVAKLTLDEKGKLVKLVVSR